MFTLSERREHVFDMSLVAVTAPARLCSKRFPDSTVEGNSPLHPIKENHMADLFRLSASEAAARIREGKLTAEALVRSCLERIDSRESQVKAWVHLDHDFTASGSNLSQLRGQIFTFDISKDTVTSLRSTICSV